MKLALNHVSKSFQSAGETVALFHDFDFSCPSGCARLLTGPSGSGKTTLLRIIYGLEPPDAGEVLFDDVSLYSLPEAERRRFRRQTIGFADQDSSLLPQLTALENVQLSMIETNIANRRWHGWRNSVWRSEAVSSRSNFREGNANASPWRAPCSRIRKSCCSMNQPPLWTQNEAILSSS